MKPRTIAVLAVTLATSVGLASGGTAAAQTSGHETFHGALVVSGRSGSRDVLATVIVAKGVFRGVGRIVEVDSRPADPDNVSRDNLVFRAGLMHIKVVDGTGDFNLDPKSCILTGSVHQTGSVIGGTKRFAHASGDFTGLVKVWALFRRHADGSCADDRAPRFEVDTVSAAGTLTF